ncbi:MAG: DUF6055 domain-containing protein [Kiritimatiellia bacterium]|nr:DUF6055 domain-containing protein [Kiritimatiellia bacterium]
MRTRKVIAGAVTLLLAAGASPGVAAENYDFFSYARYPGAGRKPGVELYKVKQAGGVNPNAYERRDVDWWPRKGVDTIEISKAMPLRTWTLRERAMYPCDVGEHLILGVEALSLRVPWNRARRFKAHLIGFRGIGNRYGNPFEPGPFFCPAVVLRLEDGTRRCFTKGTFIEEDEKWILALYRKEMEKMRATLTQDEYKLNSRVDAWPNNARPGEPGTMRVESKHFVWVSGSQHAPREKYSPWVNRFEPEKARLYREGSVAFAEDMWAYQEHAGLLVPAWRNAELSKYVITVCGTYRDGHQWLGGYAGGGGGSCAVKYAGGGPWGLTLAHEWGHGLALGPRVDGGGGEILSDSCSTICDPAHPTFYNNAMRPWRMCVHGAYGTGLFYAIMGQDPNWGYCMSITLPTGQGEPSIFHTLARVGHQRGLFRSGIRGVGDMMGEFAARLAEFDCELQENLRRDYISVKRNYLEAVDRRAGLYRIPWGESPEAFGSNVIRLVPEKGAERIAVDLRGFYDAATHGDWRACIVVAGADGRVRYSPLWNKGVMKMALKPGDRRFWLTVAATPSALFTVPGRGGIGMLLNGRHAYRYPYEVKLTACRPGTPRNRPGDVEDYGLNYLGGWRNRFDGGVCVIPNPGDTPQAKFLSEALPAVRAELDKVKAETEKAVADDKIDTEHWRWLRRYVPHLRFLDRHVDWMQDGIKGHRHPNGGGWVSDSSEVAPTAYVAPDAMVLNGARVLDHAAIEDFAVIRGPGVVVSGNAKISGQAYIHGDIKISGYTRVVHPVVVPFDNQVSGYTKIVHPEAKAGHSVVPNEVPLRPMQEKDDGEKLWANYAMDAPEAEVLEDWFRYTGKDRAGGRFYVLNLNGHLYGQPEFVMDGEHRGFHFDGRTQYAEASPLLADLGQLTVEIGLNWEGGANQAVFDFGTSSDSRFVLTPSGPSGRAELEVTLAGTTERIVADAALPKDTWVRCRVEIDGKRIALWIDDRKAAEKASGFRPADVYPQGIEKRNFIAATRRGKRHFKGSLDYLRVYYAVYEDFTTAPAARRHAPRRITREFVDACIKEYDGVDKERAALINEKMKPMSAYYDDLRKQSSEVLKEIESITTPEVAEARRRHEEARQKLADRERELKAEFNNLPEAVGKPGGRHPDSRAYVAARTGDLKKKVVQASIVLGEAVKENTLKYKPEHDWLKTLGWLAFSGHYNYPYRSYMKKEVERSIGGKVNHEDFRSLESLLEAQSQATWHRACDWDWRLRWEIDGSVKDLPRIRRWIEWVRGPVQMEDPAGAKKRSE